MNRQPAVRCTAAGWGVRLALAGALAAGASGAWGLPRYDDVRAAHRPSESLLLDRHGEVVHRLRTDFAVRRGPWVPLDDMSAALLGALVYSEDKRFWEHSGVDWRAVSAAAWGNLFNTRTRGASTLTMQLAGLLDAQWRAGPDGRTVVQKLGQAVAAQRLESAWRKDQILEAYLNLVPFRGELVGIAALSHSLFGKAPSGLDRTEAAIAAALVRAPNAPAAAVRRRACGVLQALDPAATTAQCEMLDLQLAAALQRKDYAPSDGIAPHLARRLLTSPPGTPAGAAPATVRSTLDASLQRVAAQSLQQHLRELRGRQVEDGAVVVLDNRRGEVLAWVGSSGAISGAAEVDGVLALRQPGSTLKPFLYAQAIAERRLTAASLLEDAPTHIPTPAGLYIPQNYDRQFKGWVSVRTALGASLNVPAVRTLVMVSPDAFARQLTALGLVLRETGDWYGTSLALGSAEVRLLDLTNAYRSLANGGHAGPLRTLLPGRGPARPDPAAHPAAASGPALDPRAAFIISDILSDPNARARTFDTDSVLATRFWSAVKTGTSKDMRDNWAIGYSRHYTVGVWVGNASGAPMQAVSGTSGAAPVWAAVMGYLHRATPSRPPPAPPAMQQVRIRFADALEASRDEWFLPGTEQPFFAITSIAQKDAFAMGIDQKGAKSAKKAAVSPSRITSPADGTVLALDPDIPPARQRVLFTADAPGARWQLDGKPLGSGPTLPWLPWPGRHRVTLVGVDGQALDEIRLEVRGAGVRERR